MTHNKFEKIDVERHRIFANELLNHLRLGVDEIQKVFVVFIGNNTFAERERETEKIRVGSVENASYLSE